MGDPDDAWIVLSREIERLEALYAKERILRSVLSGETEAEILAFIATLRRTPTMTRMLKNLSEVLVKYGSPEQRDRLRGLGAGRLAGHTVHK